MENPKCSKCGESMHLMGGEESPEQIERQGYVTIVFICTSIKHFKPEIIQRKVKK